jgi:peptidoglycan/LPS O-acetylase OafA/YrhL
MARYAHNSEYSQTFAGASRIEPLTGIRWFAALAVFFSHYPVGDGTPAWLRCFFLSGYMGVTVFFVLSGFILTVTYREALSRPDATSVWNFAVARVARIYPVYLLVLAFVVVQERAGGKSVGGWWLHALGGQAWSGDVQTTYRFNSPAWSVGVELFLYACLPLLLFLLAGVLASARGSLVLGVVVAGAMGLVVLSFHRRGWGGLVWTDPRSAHRWLFLSPVFRLGDFLLGIAAASVYFARRHRPPGIKLTVAVEVALVCGILFMMSRPSLFESAGSWDVIYAVPAAVLLFFVASRPRAGVGFVLGLPLVVALGEASYAFYLLHEPLGEALGASVDLNASTPAGAALYVFQIALLALLAWGIHVAVERPSRRVIRRALSRATRRRPVEASAQAALVADA